MQNINKGKLLFLALAAGVLVGCERDQNSTGQFQLATGLEIAEPAFLGASNYIAQFRLKVTNISSNDLCLVSYDRLGIARQPTNASVARVGMPTFDVGGSGESGISIVTDPDRVNRVLYVKSGETASAIVSVNARDFIVELVRNDPEDEFFYDLGDQYKTSGGASVFECENMLDSYRITTAQLVNDRINQTNGFTGIINIPRSEIFMFD